jgi:hypothetical protein
MVMVRKVGVSLLFVLLCGSPLLAQQWAEQMFENTRHDFGTVARGAKSEYRFVLSNRYVEDVHVAGVRSSCGCTSVWIEKPLLKTYEKGAIVAHFNTDKFTGRKGATITVTFDKPFRAQAQLHVTGEIRSNVQFEPGSVQFGTVDCGTPAEKTVQVTYSGRSDWEIVDVTSMNPHFSVRMEAVKARRGQVTYELFVRLDEQAPPGYLNDCLMLMTNDSKMPQIPLAVEGLVQAGISVTPTSLFMGVLQPGQKVTKQLVVRGKKPFRILSVKCDDNGECFLFDPSTASAPKPLHLIPVTFVAGDQLGKVLKTIRIETDLEEASPELSAYAVVAAKAS